VLLAVTALAFSAAAVAPWTAAYAQNPEKFERVVPANPQVPAPRASFSPAQREIVAKAEAKARYTRGDCAKFTMVDSSYLNKVDAFYAMGAGAIREWRTTFGNPVEDACGVERIAAAFSEAGTRCLRVQSWICRIGWADGCFVKVKKACKKAQGWQETEIQ